MVGRKEERDTTHNLVDALNVITKENILLQRSIDDNNIEDVMKFSTTIASLLRSGDLTPEDYYQLYILSQLLLSQSLNSVYSYFMECVNRNKYPEDLYESAQYIPHIVPRLYMMIVTGCVCIKTKTFPCKMILKDLIDMCKGVQHPTRGLFLRYYLVKMVKNMLPDTGSDYEGEGGNIIDCINLLLRSFVEMDQLWIRMQRGSSVTRSRREEQRRSLQILIGENLQTLSQLEGLTPELYKEKVLPEILKEIINSRDTISQDYFLDCVINAFSDDLLVYSLNLFVESLPRVNEDVDISKLLVSLLKRLTQYAQKGNEKELSQLQDLCINDGDIFKSLGSFVTSCLLYRKSITFAEMFQLCGHIYVFINKLFGTQSKKVNLMLKSLNDSLRENFVEFIDSDAGTFVTQFLSSSITALGLDALTIDQLPLLINYLPLRHKRHICNLFLQSLISGPMIPVTNDEELDRIDSIYYLLRPLLIDFEGESLTATYSEMLNMAKLTFKFEAQGEYLLSTIKRISFFVHNGGKDRVYLTIPPLINRLFDLLFHYHEPPVEDSVVDEILKSIYDLLPELTPTAPSTALKFYLESAFLADKLGNKNMCLELFTQVYIILEANPQLTTDKSWLQLLISSLQKCTHLEYDSYKSLRTRIDHYCNGIANLQDKNELYCESMCLLLKDEKDFELVPQCIDKCVELTKESEDPEEKLRLLLTILGEIVYIRSVKESIVQKDQIDSLLKSVDEEKEKSNIFDHEIEKYKSLLA